MAKKRIMWMLGATLSGGAAAQKPSPKSDAPTVTITLRVMDGETGLPMRSPKLELGCRTAAGQRCSVQRRVQTADESRQGLVKFQVSADAAAIYEASAKYQDCNLLTAPQIGELPITTARGGLSVKRTMVSGVTMGNACAATGLPADAARVSKSGEVLLFYRRGSRGRVHASR
jgi:hypothetical protein